MNNIFRPRNSDLATIPVLITPINLSNIAFPIPPIRFQPQTGNLILIPLAAKLLATSILICVSKSHGEMWSGRIVYIFSFFQFSIQLQSTTPYYYLTSFLTRHFIFYLIIQQLFSNTQRPNPAGTWQQLWCSRRFYVRLITVIISIIILNSHSYADCWWFIIMQNLWGLWEQVNWFIIMFFRRYTVTIVYLLCLLYK